jgi:hypothetical protein
MATPYNNVLSLEDLAYINALPEVLEAKQKVDVLPHGKVSFTILQKDSLRAALFSKLGLDLSHLDNIPMQWIKGDTDVHIDSGQSAFEQTYLVYLTSTPGEFVVDTNSYPIVENTAYLFNRNLSHKTVNTDSSIRLLLGPVSEKGFCVAAPPTSGIIYYANSADALSNTNPIGSSSGFTITLGDEAQPPVDYYWRISSNSQNIFSNPSIVYTNGDILDGITSLYYLYRVFIIYYPTQAGALSPTTTDFSDTESTYTITQGNTNNPPTIYTWKIASSSTGTSSQANYYRNDAVLNTGGVYFLYRVPVILFFNTQADAVANVNSTGSNSEYTAIVPKTNPAPPFWKIASTSTGTSNKTYVYATGDPLEPDGIYYLYPELSIVYFTNQQDADSNTNVYGYSDNYTIEIGGEYAGLTWRIAANSTGSSNKATLYRSGDTLINDGYYLLYPSAPCFLEGTKILCSVDNKEVYVPIEQIRHGTLVKTSRDGYKRVECIGKGTLYNPGNTDRIENRLYKCSPSVYPELNEDLYITGCHSILVDTITYTEKAAILKSLGRIFVTDKKYRLMASIDARAQPWNSEGTYTIWHFALENADIRMNYGVYANGLLVESCSINSIKTKANLTLL